MTARHPSSFTSGARAATSMRLERLDSGCNSCRDASDPYAPRARVPQPLPGTEADLDDDADEWEDPVADEVSTVRLRRSQPAWPRGR